jgi:predicted house-cleaning noncanonical NTP pyrophosphatase (MazG superfamily)
LRVNRLRRHKVASSVVSGRGRHGMEYYFVISNSDGDTTVHQLSKEELTERLNSRYYGENIEFLDKTPESDTNYWMEKYLIIKGNICVPTQAMMVLKYKVD